MTIDIEKLAEEHLTPFARTGWTAYGEQLKQFAEALLEDKEREIAELKTTVRSDNSKEIAELKAHINDLRDALNAMRDAFDIGGDVTSDENTALYKADKSIVKTPAQSLQEHDNEVIEKCAKVCDEAGQPNKDEIHTDAQWAAKVLAANIRALKGQP